MEWILIGLVLAVLIVTFLPQLKGWRTLFFGYVGTLGLGGVLPYIAEASAYLNGLDWRQYVPEHYAPIIIIVIGIVNVILRKKTTTPVGQK
jgi:hypothetical protein